MAAFISALYLFLLCRSLPRPRFNQPQSTPATAKRLSELYRVAATSFWKAENELQSRLLNGEERNVLFSPLPADDPLRREYSRAATAVDQFIKTADEINHPIPPAMLYLGGQAKYSLGDFSGALILLERVPDDYKRDFYYSDNYQPNPEYSVPTSAGISKLIFYLRLQVALKNTPDAFASLKQITRDALATLTAQREYARWLVAHSDPHNPKIYDEAMMGSQPDQRRASVLPSTLTLVEEAWDKLLEPALKKAGARPMREWLRGLSTPEAPLARQALYRLQNIDQLIIKQLFAEAQNLMNAKNFDGARAKYRQIMAEYSGTEAAKQAEEALPKIVPIAVAHYKNEGDKHYRPQAPDQFYVPQVQATEYYAKMYNEAKDVPGMEAQADYAFFKWSEALATHGDEKTRQAMLQLEEHLRRYPKSEMRPKALFLLGLINANYGVNRPEQAIKYFKQLLSEYPRTDEAPHGLWITGIVHAVNNRFAEAIAAFEQLQKDYPQNPRRPNAQGFVTFLQRKINNGESW